MTYRQERRCYSCRQSVFLLTWSGEWNWYSGFRKKTPSPETKLQCGAAFPSHQCFCGEICRADCNSSPWVLRIGTWCSQLTPHHASTGISAGGPRWGTPPISSKLHWQTSILAGENISRARVLLWVSQGWLERVLGAVAVEWQCACLHFPPAVPALALAPPPQEQIVGCTWCSWPSPDVSPRVPAIDGWSKNSPCFPVYALRLPPRSSWIKTAGLDKIAFLFIALGTSMVMVERGWVAPNHLLAAVLSCGIRWLQRAAHGLFGALAPSSHSPRHTPLSVVDQKKAKGLALWDSFLPPWGIITPGTSQLDC